MAEVNRKIVLENGMEVFGQGFGGEAEGQVFELTFNTGVVGYQELLSDPSCADMMVVMTYPLIGNYGIADEDFESKNLSLGGLVVREYNDFPSNFRYTKTLSEIMEENHIPGLSGVDTRMLTRIIRDNGACRAMICDLSVTREEALRRIEETPVPHDAVRRVSCKKRWYSRTPNHRFQVVAIDLGVKFSIIRQLNRRGCNVTVVPYDTRPEDILAMQPDGVIISNGPGDPADVSETVETIRALRGRLPMLGIALGHLALCRAYGAETFKLKFGHHGGNHPVRCLKTGKITMSTQGHGFNVKEESLENTDLTITYKNLLDGTVEGVACEEELAMGVQFHPESAPGPQDNLNLFDKFIGMMKEAKKNA